MFETEIQADLDAKELAGMRRSLRSVPVGVLDLASNDYLGLARHPEVIEAACAAVREFGAGARASRLISGHTDIHACLEEELAAFCNCEAALVFPSGFQANLAVITALARRGDVVFCDKRNHASLIDACRLASANGTKVRYYPTPERLAELIESYAKQRQAERFFIVSDTIYSMDGDQADAPRLVELSAQFDAQLVLDHAHGMGVLGVGDWGPGVEFAAPSRNQLPTPITTATLSKALGSQGGFVAGPRIVVDWLVNSARPFIYSTGLNPASCGAALKSLEIIRREPQRAKRLRDVTQQLADGIRRVGFDACLQPSPIIPVMVGEAARAVTLSEKFLERGIWCPAIRPPTVPAGTSRLRVTASATLDDADIAHILAVFAEVQHELS